MKSNRPTIQPSSTKDDFNDLSAQMLKNLDPKELEADTIYLLKEYKKLQVKSEAQLNKYVKTWLTNGSKLLITIVFTKNYHSPFILLDLSC